MRFRLLKMSTVLVDRAVHAQRIAECDRCPHRLGPFCGKCGCIVRVKTWVAISECPDDPPRWPVYKGHRSGFKDASVDD